MAWVWRVHPAVFGTFWSHNTAKSVPNGPGFDQKWLSKGPYAAGKMLAKCIFGHKNTLCQPVSRTVLFLECRGGWVSFQCKILATACLCAVPFHDSAPKFLEVNPPNAGQNASKSPKHGVLVAFWKAIAIPSRSFVKGIKNKKFDRFWVPRYLPLSPDWVATCPIKPPVRNDPPPFGAK